MCLLTRKQAGDDTVLFCMYKRANISIGVAFSARGSFIWRETRRATEISARGRHGRLFYWQDSVALTFLTPSGVWRVGLRPIMQAGDGWDNMSLSVVVGLRCWHQVLAPLDEGEDFVSSDQGFRILSFLEVWERSSELFWSAAVSDSLHARGENGLAARKRWSGTCCRCGAEWTAGIPHAA
jgi:hypothetical protein